MKMDKPVYEFEQISFCQTQPIFDGTKYRMVRDPRVAMAKDLCCLLDITTFERTKSVWYNAMHHGGLALTSGIPCWQSFYQMFPKAEVSIGKRETTLNNLEQSGMFRMIGTSQQAKIEEIQAKARYSFWMAFGILPDQQIVLEKRFSNISLARCERNDKQEYSELSLLVENLPLSR